MKEISVTAERTYSVSFVDDVIKNVENEAAGRDVCVIVSKTIRELELDWPTQWHVIVVPDGEDQKSGAVYLDTLEQMSQRGLSRGSLVIGIGGGATTDLAGFVAATYLRGIEWIAIPTSLAGMVDAAIGGKTGINLATGKNLVGAFHSPSAVKIDVKFLDTLPVRDLIAGMAEVAKCGFISDTRILDLIKEGWRDNLQELIFRSIAVKATFVSQDFRESYAREALNYGHTLGHAIERHSNYSLRHGECVSIGLIYAAELSALKSGLTEQGVEEHYRIMEQLGLPTSYGADAWEAIVDFMQRDKKKGEQGLRFVTLDQLGSVTRCENVSADELKSLYIEKIAR